MPGSTNGATQVSAEYAYNVNGDVTEAKTINSLGGWSITTYEYLNDTDPTFGTLQRNVPFRNQPLRVTDALGNEWHLRYDTRGNLLLMRDPTGAITEYQYNLAGQLFRVNHPATGQTGAGNGSTQYTYSTPGGAVQKVEEYDESNNLVFTENYALSKEADVRGVSGNLPPVASPKDGIGRITGLTDGNANTTAITYNNAGTLSRLTRPITTQQIRTPSTNAEGQALSSTNARNETAVYTRASDDSRVTAVQYNTDTALNVAYTYDLYNRVTGVTDAGGTRAWTYDDLGNVLTETTTFTGLAGSYAISYTYNPDGSVATQATPAGNHSYQYDDLGRCLRISSGTFVPQRLDFEYDKLGRVRRQLSYFFDTRVSYNLRGQTTTIFHVDLRGGNVIRSRWGSIRYNGAGYPISAVIAQEEIGSAPARGGTVAYTYDAQYNLTGEQRWNAANVLLYGFSASWDTAANPTLVNGVARPVNANAEISGVGGFAYDAQGNPTAYDGLTLGWNAADAYTGNGRYTLRNFSDGRVASRRKPPWRVGGRPTTSTISKDGWCARSRERTPASPPACPTIGIPMALGAWGCGKTAPIKSPTTRTTSSDTSSRGASRRATSR